MLLNFRFYLVLFIMPLLLVSCSKDDNNNQASEEAKRYSKFTISGGLNGEYIGENTLIIINTQPEDGAAVTWSANSPEGEEPFWSMDFASIEGANQELVPGEYKLGNIEDFDEGKVDFVVTFQVHNNEDTWPYLWGGLGAVSGTLRVTEVQKGHYDNAKNDLVLGTFEFKASDNNINGALSREPLEDIVVINGEFRAKMGSF